MGHNNTLNIFGVTQFPLQGSKIILPDYHKQIKCNWHFEIHHSTSSYISEIDEVVVTWSVYKRSSAIWRSVLEWTGTIIRAGRQIEDCDQAYNGS